jgi:hypothetical protein
LQRLWILYGLAVVATIGTLLCIVIEWIVVSQQSLAFMVTLLHVQPIIGVADALLYILFVCWLVRHFQNSRVA